jgi:hypothetical protein
MPLGLMLAAVLLASWPGDGMFLLISAVGAAAALVAAGIQIMWLREFRLNWVLADGLMLGYALGAFNSAARLQLAGIPVAEYFARPAEDLSTALAAVLLVCAALFWLGGRMTPIMFNVEKLHSTDAPLLWFGVLLVGAALMTGTLGYQGVSASDDGHVSILGQLAATAAPVLPAFTLLLQKNFRSSLARVLCWPVMAITLAALVPQGRRALIYGVLLVILAFSLRGSRIRLLTWKTALILLPACGLLYAGNVFFYAMRVSSYQSGGAKTSLPGLTEKAASLLQRGGNGSLGDQVERNLRDRTFVIRYLSDLLNASWQREALHGQALLFCVESAIPSVLFPDKDRIRAIGMEENLANPQFGLFPTDEANSVLTTGVSDFGIAGMFLYPAVLIVLMQVFLKAVAGRMPEAARLFLILCVLNTLWQTELSTGGYFVLCRNLLLLSLPLTFLAKLGAYLSAPARPRRSIVSNSWKLA